VDLERLVQSSELFTPADIEFAAHKGAQSAFEREVLHHEGRPTTTEDYLAAIAEMRPTLTPDTVAEFQQDIDLYSRV
jgi:SpoVK/Ycf46/Vps4 family AAA+-type ATPase